MRKTFLLFTCVYVIANLSAQTFTLTVNDGYGGGSYNAGDTAHFWAREMAITETFKNWSGATVNDENEWHSYIVMPAANTIINANFNLLPVFTPVNEQIMGRDTLKNVFYHFPTNYKGVVYFLHGSNGSAAGWTMFCENLQMVKAVIADTFAIVITEAEEVTYNNDFNGDGALRWSSDTLDADYENIRIITDTLIARGIMQNTDKQIALGMSNGGTFSFSCANRLNFDIIVSNCAQGLPQILSEINIPAMWCMANQDGHPNVGSAANSSALAFSDSLLNKGICSEYYLNYNKPLYPQIFKRINGIGAILSTQLFNELDNVGWIYSNNYINVDPDTIIVDIMNDSASYPVYSGLNPLQQADYANLLNSTYAEHQLFNDHTSKIIAFINNPCVNSVLGIEEINSINNANFSIYPNPTSNMLFINNNIGVEIKDIVVYNCNGQVKMNIVPNVNNNYIDVNELTRGLYFISINENRFKFIKN